MYGLREFNHGYKKKNHVNHPFLCLPDENIDFQYISDSEVIVKSWKITQEILENEVKVKIMDHFKTLLRNGCKKLTYLFESASDYDSFCKKVQKLNKRSKIV